MYVLAQNVVSNPSFEVHNDCTTPNISNAPPWTGPTTNSTDYLNICIGNVPSPGAGYYQWPRTGNAYAGFHAAFNGSNYREYSQTLLTNPLVIGICYYIEFYINLANRVSVGVNNIAAHLSNTTYPTNVSFPGTVLNLTPHALKFGNPVITDTLNWVKVSGVYTATGGENYIIIGDFKDDAHTDSIGIDNGIYRLGYYFLDDVSVIPTDSISMPPYAGKDTTIVLGDSVFIGQQLYGLHCNWYSNSVLLDTNISGIWVKPTVTTTYIVEQNLCGNMGYDTVVVSVSPLGINKYATNSFDADVYPNPNSGNSLFITTTGLTNKRLQIKVSDLEGRTVVENNCTVSNGVCNLKINDIKNGVYFVYITNTLTGDHIVKKIVIQY